MTTPSPASASATSPAVISDRRAPLNAVTLAGAVQSALARDNARVPSRSEAERETVSRAKALLMARQSMTEPQAHRALQRYAMDRGIKMTAAAEEFLRKAAD